LKAVELTSQETLWVSLLVALLRINVKKTFKCFGYTYIKLQDRHIASRFVTAVHDWLDCRYHSLQWQRTKWIGKRMRIFINAEIRSK